MFCLIIVSIIFASLNSALLHKVNLSGNSAVYKFNMLVSAVWCVLLFAINGFKLNIDATILFWGILYGVTQALFIFLKHWQ